MSTSRKRGFATLSPAQRQAISRAGGKAKVSKGFAKLTPEERKELASKAARKRWEDIKRKEQDEQDSISEGN